MKLAETVARLDPSDVKALYVACLDALHKAEPSDVDAAQLQALLEGYEGKLITTLLGILKSSRASFLRQLPKHEDIENTVTQLIDQSLSASLKQKLTDALTPIAADFIEHSITNYRLDISYAQANELAITALEQQTDNVFTTLSYDLARSVTSAIAQAKSDVHTLTDIIAAVRSVYAKDITTKDGRVLDNGTWAKMVARTEGTRAAAAGARAAITTAGATTWVWMAEGSACDICEPNDGETVAIGDAFPSGDDAPPAHPNCRCVVMPNIHELTEQD